MDIIFNDTITFPNMTFCMSKKHAWSHFVINMTNVTEWNSIIQVKFFFLNLKFLNLKLFFFV